MSLGVSDFIANFGGGGARPNLYRVKILGAPVSFGGREQFMCKAAALPASTIGLADVSYMGRKVKVAGDRDFADWTATFYNDTDFSLRNAFEEWVNIMNHNINNDGKTNVLDYYGEIQVEQLDRKDAGASPLAQYNLLNVMPTEVSEITLGYDQNDTVEEFTVTFAYNHFDKVL